MRRSKPIICLWLSYVVFMFSAWRNKKKKKKKKKTSKVIPITVFRNIKAISNNSTCDGELKIEYFPLFPVGCGSFFFTPSPPPSAPTHPPLPPQRTQGLRRQAKGGGKHYAATRTRTHQEATSKEITRATNEYFIGSRSPSERF